MKDFKDMELRAKEMNEEMTKLSDEELAKVSGGAQSAALVAASIDDSKPHKTIEDSTKAEGTVYVPKVDAISLTEKSKFTVTKADA